MRALNPGDKRNDIKNRILITEGLRVDKKYREAIQGFEGIENGKDWGDLSERQKRWVWAHHGAAEQEVFVPHTDGEGHLDEAERLLRKALGVDDSTDLLALPSPEKYAWAWARLGEVLRLKANLFAFELVFVPGSGADHRLVLRARHSDRDYERSARCFEISSRQRPGYPWADAHHGAMILNARRYAAATDWQRKEEATKKAGGLLESAIRAQNHRNPWTLVHESGVHFVTFLDTMIKSLDDRKALSCHHEDERKSTLLSHYSLIMAFSTDSSDVYRDPLHPGAIGRDEYLTLTYDMFEYLPLLDGLQGKNDPVGLDISKTFWEIVVLTLVAGFNFLQEDDSLRKSHHFRFVYAILYTNFHWKKYLAWTRAESTLLAESTPLGDLFERFDEHTKILCTDPARYLQYASDILDAATLPNNRRPADNGIRSHHLKHGSDHTGCGVLLRLFDMMMILLKVGAMATITKDSSTQGNIEKTLEDIVKTLEDFEKVIPVLSIQPRAAIDLLAELAEKGDAWLLAPQWALDDKKRKTVGRFLKINGSIELGNGG